MSFPPSLPVIMVPGYGNSEPQHWQGLWHSRWPDSVWTEQRDWENPERDLWVATLEKTVRAAGRPALLIGHSLGCSTIAEWSFSSEAPVLGALLVAPPDCLAPSFPAAIRGYQAPTSGRLRFPSWVAWSEDDPYSTPERSLAMADGWGAQAVACGRHGHLNLEAGLGEWPQGEALVAQIAHPLTHR